MKLFLCVLLFLAFTDLLTLLWKYDNYYVRAIFIVYFVMSWYWSSVFWLQLLRTTVAASFEYYKNVIVVFRHIKTCYLSSSRLHPPGPLLLSFIFATPFSSHSVKLDESLFIYVPLQFKSTVYVNCQLITCTYWFQSKQGYWSIKKLNSYGHAIVIQPPSFKYIN